MTTQTVAGMVATARQEIQNLSIDQLADELQEGNVILVDIREPEERSATGTIPGSMHAVRGMLEFYADPASPYHRTEFETSQRVVLYCASGGRSALATKMLRQLGYANSAHLDGGFKAWSGAGLPVETA